MLIWYFSNNLDIYEYVVKLPKQHFSVQLFSNPGDKILFLLKFNEARISELNLTIVNKRSGFFQIPFPGRMGGGRRGSESVFVKQITLKKSCCNITFSMLYSTEQKNIWMRQQSRIQPLTRWRLINSTIFFYTITCFTVLECTVLHNEADCTISIWAQSIFMESQPQIQEPRTEFCSTLVNLWYLVLYFTRVK